MSTASEVKHTAGPWNTTQRRQGRSPFPQYSIESAEIYVAKVDINMASEANARLIAAAPTMLEALEKLCAIRPQSACDENPDHYPESCRWCKAKAVIRLAKGETK